jgi:hypothetical protein
VARKFFYIAAGMLMLALSYHLGARDAAGQSTPVIEATSYDSGGFFAVFGGAWNQIDTHTGSVFLSYPLPVHAPVAGTGNDLLLYENGDLYVYEGLPGAWVLKGNVFGGPTPALHESWGQLKSRYHTTPPATPGMTATPGASER